MSNTYVLATGETAEPRLAVIDRLYSKTSLQFLKKIGLKNCKIVADVGCGTGQMICRIAKALGNSAQVIGVDQNEEQLILAKKLAKKLRIRNIDFICKDIYDCQSFVNQFDLIYCRSLLIHLHDPITALKMMQQMLRTQGILACEEYNLSTCFSYPENLAVIKANNLFAQLARKYNLDAEIGIKLFSLLKKIGLKHVNVSFSQIVATKPEDKVLLAMGLKERRPKFLENNLATIEELDELYIALREFEKDEMSFIGYWRFCQVWGYKNLQ